MKKLIYITLLLLLSHNLYSKNYIDVVKNNKIVGRVSYETFVILTESSEKYSEIIIAQKENRVTIICDEIKQIEKTNKYKTILKIQWFNKQNKQINFITSEMILIIDNGEQLLEWRIVYRNISEIGFPITSGILILILIILI